MRDRLIELIQSKSCDSIAYTECMKKTSADCEKICRRISIELGDCEKLADHLLANGVIVPPYKVGQIVYVVRSQTSNGQNLYMSEERVDHYRVFGERTFMCFESTRLSVPDYLWETTVFLIKEDAEQKLKEVKG